MRIFFKTLFSGGRLVRKILPENISTRISASYVKFYDIFWIKKERHCSNVLYTLIDIYHRSSDWSPFEKPLRIID